MTRIKTLQTERRANCSSFAFFHQLYADEYYIQAVRVFHHYFVSFHFISFNELHHNYGLSKWVGKNLSDTNFTQCVQNDDDCG